MTPAAHKKLILIAEGLADGLNMASACRRLGIAGASGRHMTRVYAPVLQPSHSDRPLFERARDWLASNRDRDPAEINPVGPERIVSVLVQNRGTACRYYLAREMRECGRPSNGHTYCPECEEKTLNPNERGVFTRGLR